MPMRRKHRRPVFAGFRAPRLSAKSRFLVTFLISALILTAAIAPSAVYLRKLSIEIALSIARDTVTTTISDIVYDELSDGGYGYDYFVTLEKDAEGNISAITTNMNNVNSLTAEILRSVIARSGSGSSVLNIDVPLGTITGPSFLVGRGPKIPVEIVFLTSTYAEFHNEFTSAGINQTRHQIYLNVMVDTDVIIPWERAFYQVSVDILVAETVIVGKIPDTVINWP